MHFVWTQTSSDVPDVVVLAPVRVSHAEGVLGLPMAAPLALGIVALVDTALRMSIRFLPSLTVHGDMADVRQVTEYVTSLPRIVKQIVLGLLVFHRLAKLVVCDE